MNACWCFVTHTVCLAAQQHVRCRESCHPMQAKSSSDGSSMAPSGRAQQTLLRSAPCGGKLKSTSSARILKRPSDKQPCAETVPRSQSRRLNLHVIAASNYVLCRCVGRYQTLLQDAAASDNQVRSKLVQHQDDIAQLGCTRQQLDGIMPRVDDIASMSQQERQEVENLVVETSSILESRDSDVAELDKIAPTLDIKQPLLRDSARKVSSGGIFEIDDKEALFEKTMAPLSSIVGRIHESVQTQPALLERLAAANTAFDAKQQSNPVLSRRSQILSGLQQGVSSFKEVEANISQGRKFYEQFRDRVHELSARVQDYLRVRDLEAREHIAAIERPSIPSPVPARSPMPSQSPAPAPAGQQAFGRVAAPPPAYAPPPSYGAASSSSGYGSSAPAARAVALPGYNSNTSAPAPSGYVRAAPVVATTVRATPVTTVRATPVPAAHVRATPVRATPVSGASSSSSSGASWTCKMCTFINQKPNALACEMCNSMRE